MFAIDPDKGTILWTVDHGSPGASSRYAEGGAYKSFTVDPATGTIAGLIVDAEPQGD